LKHFSPFGQSHRSVYCVGKMNTPAIFRFELDSGVVREIATFANEHKDDERRAYKEAWGVWCEEHQPLIAEEIRRLQNIGYDGDIPDKMYKAGRYYFRKKSKSKAAAAVVDAVVDVAPANAGADAAATEERKDTETETAPVKRGYVKLQPDTLVHIDTHIKGSLNDNDFTPAKGYQAFANEHVDVFNNEKEHLKDFGLTEMDVRDKLKKTYKNRYYSISRA